VAPVTAVALGVLAVGLGLANVALDLRTHQPGALLSDGTWLGFLLPAVPASDYAFLDYRMHHGTLPFAGYR
jgi:hypothetical protein